MRHQCLLDNLIVKLGVDIRLRSISQSARSLRRRYVAILVLPFFHR